ncbi:hypothetical protein DCCM_3446 [Desulfocucumis palustris]|uniref:Uncharacterized protein n=1 Tax=Desulfocucumis palustris TaxID=1898651 RepID=A0A2L2XEA4_9FIRM|nr:hypothetical protein [Desulfocucumis palustris]GBF34334.1 hypothetical protein DCCM_3446 [Desulfocucumis palustris]
MNREIIAQVVYIIILAIMIISALWVMYDTRKRGLPLMEILAWGLFTGVFFGMGLLLYFYWRRKFPDFKNPRP